MRIFVGTALFSIVLAAASVQPASAGPALAGPMTRFQNLTGTWECASVATMPRGQRQTFHMHMTFDVVGSNALHDHLSADGFDAHLYYGYDSAKKRYWANTANSDGTQLQQTSEDGKYFAGSIVQHPAVRISDTFEFARGTFRIHDVTTVKAGDIVTDSTCTRPSGAST